MSGQSTDGGAGGGTGVVEPRDASLRDFANAAAGVMQALGALARSIDDPDTNLAILAERERAEMWKALALAGTAFGFVCGLALAAWAGAI